MIELLIMIYAALLWVVFKVVTVHLLIGTLNTLKTTQRIAA